MDFDFYYGLQAQTFSFYRIPKLLFTDSRFSSLSAEAKTLYGILLDRMDLSMKNGWLDKQNRVYLFFTVQEIQESLGCGKNKAIHLMKELEKMGLIERKRQGMGKPSFVYVKNILSCPESGLKRFRNQTSGGLESKLQEVGKLNSNHTDYSQTDQSQNNQSYPEDSDSEKDDREVGDNAFDTIRKREDYRRYFREELGIDELKTEYPSNAEMIEELFELIVDTVFGSREQSQIGQNYLRSLLALGFQGFLILICVGIYAVMVQGIAFTDDVIGSIWGVMGYTVLLCFTLFKTGTLAKGVFNCH